MDSPSSNSVKTSICREGSTPSPQAGGSGVGVGGGRRKERGKKSPIKMYASSSRAAKNRVWETTLGNWGEAAPSEPHLRPAAKALNSGAPRPISLTYFKPLWGQSSPRALRPWARGVTCPSFRLRKKNPNPKPPPMPGFPLQTYLGRREKNEVSVPSQRGPSVPPLPAQRRGHSPAPRPRTKQKLLSKTRDSMVWICSVHRLPL